MSREPVVYTPQMLADRWLCSVHTIRNMIHDGQVLAFRVGHELRVTAAEVQRVESSTAPRTDLLSI